MLLTLLLVLGQAPDAGPEPSTPAQELINRTTEGEYVEQVLDDGKHVRFGTSDSGPVHVWRPRSYRADTAVTVVYVHGFFTSVDQAMREHQLTAQFRDSGRNALFIVPEARSWRTDPVVWPDLDDAAGGGGEAAQAQAAQGAHRGDRSLGRVPHASRAGCRTRTSRQVLLVDGLYGNETDFKHWLDSPPAPRQLVLVGFDTQQRAEWSAQEALGLGAARHLAVAVRRAAPGDSQRGAGERAVGAHGSHAAGDRWAAAAVVAARVSLSGPFSGRGSR